MPPAIKDRFVTFAKVQASDEASHKKLQRLAEAQAKLDGAKSELQTIQRTDWPYNVPGFWDAETQKQMRNNWPDYVEKAATAITAAEAQVKEARAACSKP
jgi:hypothetical protein